MQPGQLRYIIALMVGIFFALFGVFIFGDFRYRGLTLQEHVFPLLKGGSFESFSDGFYQLIGSGFMVDWFTVFSSANIEEQHLGTIVTSESVWPAICTWFIGGFFVGTVAKGSKRGIIAGLATFMMVFLFWIIWGFFVGADITAIFQNNLKITLGELLTALIFILPGSLLGGYTSGPFN